MAAATCTTAEDDRMRAILLECRDALKAPDAPTKLADIATSLRAIQGTIASARFGLTHCTRQNRCIYSAVSNVYEAKYQIVGSVAYLGEYTKRKVFELTTSAAGFIDAYLSSGVFPAAAPQHDTKAE